MGKPQTSTETYGKKERGDCWVCGQSGPRASVFLGRWLKALGKIRRLEEKRPAEDEEREIRRQEPAEYETNGRHTDISRWPCDQPIGTPGEFEVSRKVKMGIMKKG